MESTSDDPVFHLLSEWLQGANQEEDARPVTWRTLIMAMRHARVYEEANILEYYLVQLEPDNEDEDETCQQGINYTYVNYEYMCLMMLIMLL